MPTTKMGYVLFIRSN